MKQISQIKKQLKHKIIMFSILLVAIIFGICQCANPIFLCVLSFLLGNYFIAAFGNYILIKMRKNEG